MNQVIFIAGYDGGEVQFALIFAPGDTLGTCVVRMGPSSGTSKTKENSWDEVECTKF